MGRPAKADRRAAKLGDSNARTARLRACRSSSERPTSGESLCCAGTKPWPATATWNSWLIEQIWDCDA
jgi:hypothetical protein